MTWLHPYARFVCAATLLLITAGGMVTSTGSGLAVPDWPNTYGYFMFSFPLSKMVGGIFYEHGHRMIASIVGLLTLGLTVWLWRAEPRRWIRRLGVAALAAVILQGLLGGLTVLYFLPTPISVAHAGLAQIFFCLTVCLALFTSAGWHRSSALATHEPVIRDSTLLALATGLPLLVYTQILIGATMRHTGAGLAIPDFPLAFGRLVPPEWSFAIAVHFLHRVGAAVTSARDPGNPRSSTGAPPSAARPDPAGLAAASAGADTDRAGWLDGAERARPGDQHGAREPPAPWCSARR